MNKNQKLGLAFAGATLVFGILSNVFANKGFNEAMGIKK